MRLLCSCGENGCGWCLVLFMCWVVVRLWLWLVKCLVLNCMVCIGVVVVLGLLVRCKKVWVVLVGVRLCGGGGDEVGMLGFWCLMFC